MGFLDRLVGGGDGDDPQREADIRRVEAGGIPLAAEQRLRELGAGETAFTSELSVGAFALTRLDRVRPVCQVMGSSVYKVGWQSYPWTSWSSDSIATELRQLTEAWNDARGRALARLEHEAELAGCHAVVGVTFDQNRHDFLSDEIEVVVRGTAVHLPERSGDERRGEAGDEPTARQTRGRSSDRVVLSDLSLADYTLLRRAGYAPVGVVAASSVWYIVPSWQTQRLTTGWQRFQPNQELPDFTQGLYYARETAIGRATSDAQLLGAHGMVGVSVDEHVGHREVEQNNRERVDLIVTFHVLGTAIVELGEHRKLDVRTIVRQGAS
jgi:uncharacterized protein YbjQ (UPF0145 family)